MLVRRSRLVLSCLVLIMVAQVGIHGWTINSLLPHSKELDAALVRQSMMFQGIGPWSDHAWSKYPHLLSRLMAAFPRAQEVHVAGSATAAEELQAHLLFASRHLIAARWVIVLLSAMALPMSYALARRFLSQPWSLFAVGLLASSLLFQAFAHQARPHAATLVTTAFVFWSSDQWAHQGRHRDLVWMLLASALSIASLHNGALFLLAPAMACLWRWRRERRIPWLALVAGLAVLGVSLRLAYPFFFDRPGSEDFESGYGRYSFPHEVTAERFTGSGFGRMSGAMWRYDPVLSVLLLLGTSMLLVRALKDRRAGIPSQWNRQALVIGLPVALYLLVLGIYGKTFQRFLLPVLPALAIVASFGLSEVQRLLVPRIKSRWSPALVPAIATGLIAFALWPCARLAWLQSRPDSYEELASWALAHQQQSPEAMLLCASETLPLFTPIHKAPGHDPAHSKLKLHWLDYLANLPDGALHSSPLQILPLATEGRYPMDGAGFPKTRKQALQIARALGGKILIVEQHAPTHRPIRQLCTKSGEHLIRFGPWKDGCERSDDLRYFKDDFRADVLAAERLGPVFDVYRLP